MVATTRPSSSPSAERYAAAFGDPGRRGRPSGERSPGAAPPTLADWVWAAAATAALLPLTVVELIRAAGSPGEAAWLAVTVGLFVALHLAVVVRRRSPRGVLLVASVAMLLLTAASLPGTPTIAVLLPSSATYLVFVFTAAASEDKWADVGALVLGLLGAAAMTAVSIAHGPVPEPGPLIALAGFLVASIGAAWALGRYRRESRRKRAAEERSLAQAVEIGLQRERAAVAEERRRIGGELHDVISHSLAVMVAQAEASRVLLDRDESRARTAIEHVVATGRTAMADMRGLLTVLTEDPASEPAASPEPREPSPGLDDLFDLVERTASPGRAIQLSSTGTPRTVTPGTALTAYRVVQEALTNTLKHAGPPTRSEVRLEWTLDHLAVTVVDDGANRAPVTAPGRGVQGMRNRVEKLGGQLEIGRGEPRGWRVRATFPITEGMSHD